MHLYAFLDNLHPLRLSIPGFSYQNNTLYFFLVILRHSSWCYEVSTAKYIPMYLGFVWFPMPSPGCTLYPASGIPQINHNE